MSDRALRIVPQPDPDGAEELVHLRARIATDVAEGRRCDLVLDDLVGALVAKAVDSTAMIVMVDEREFARVGASNLPSAVHRLVHGSPRRRWFGAWASALTRRADVVVPEIGASSLYREHRARLVEHRMLAVRARPIVGRDGHIAAVAAWYLPEKRLHRQSELAFFDEVADLGGLAIRNDQSRQELLDRLRHDQLTGLENRDGLEDHIRRALGAAAGRGGEVGVLFVDIDDLTLVNDSLGHTAGDTVIATTAERIQRQLLPGDAVVRFGGDEFIIVLERIDGPDEAERFAERIRRVIGEPIQIDDTELNTTVCIGISHGRPGTPALRLIDEGHAAVVRAKQGGRGATAIHDQGLDTGAGARLVREVRLREGLDNDEFVLYWQPKIALDSGRVVGAEALVRWEHPELGVIAPDEFIATAERAGLMHDLSDWILRHAVAEAKEFTELDESFSVAINISATQLTRDDFLPLLQAAIDATGLATDHLIIELTESMLADQNVIRTLDELHRLGLRIAIDDFGTGYSSLAYLQQLPVALVKIDRAFIDGLEPSGQGAPILRAAVAMAKALGLRTIVEGVETTDQLAGLRALGVDWAQGYLFAEPGPHTSLVALLEAGERW